MEGVRSYKEMLPNSVRDIDLTSHDRVDQQHIPAASLIKGFAIFGCNENDIATSACG